MIGNDVVDLHLAEKQSNWKRPGFLFKLFTEEEQKQITSAKNKTNMVWRLWTMKEAAYKAHQRRFDLIPKFNPFAFNCELISQETGKIKIGLSEYESFTETSSNFIYSEAMTVNSLFRPTSVFKSNSSYEALKKEMLKELSARLKIPSSGLKIKKCKNWIPRILLEEEELQTAFSFTHHGEFSAFIMEV